MSFNLNSRLAGVKIVMAMVCRIFMRFLLRTPNPTILTPAIQGFLMATRSSRMMVGIIGKNFVTGQIHFKNASRLQPWY